MFESKLWELIQSDLVLEDFEQWVYGNPAIESEIGKAEYLELLQADFSDYHQIFNAIRPWAQRRYGDIDLLAYYNVVKACKLVVESDTDFIIGVQNILRVAPAGHVNWDDEDWSELLNIDDDAERYPIGVDPSLVCKNLLKDTAEFDSLMRKKGLVFCKKLMRRYGNPPINKAAN